jgi:hypothetical protein
MERLDGAAERAGIALADEGAELFAEMTEAY